MFKLLLDMESVTEINQPGTDGTFAYTIRIMKSYGL